MTFLFVTVAIAARLPVKMSMLAMRGLISKAKILQPEAGTTPRVYYLNIPGRFIAGSVLDPARKEVVSNASCILTSMDSGKSYTTSTDGFGDFWFNELEIGNYSLIIEKDGKTKTVDSLNTQKSVNLGEITFT